MTSQAKSLNEGVSWIKEIMISDSMFPSVTAIKEYMNEYPLMVIRGCRFTKETLLDFASQFGQPLKKASVDPVIELIPNIEGTTRAGTFSSITKMEWHSDRSFDKETPSYSFLYGLEMGPGSGATHWSNTHLAYQNLPADIKARVATLKCKHELGKFANSYEDSIYKFKSAGHQRIAFSQQQTVRDVVGKWNDKPFLFINRGYTSEIIGEDADFLEMLLKHVEDPRWIYTHHWTTGDLLISNNRVMIHSRDESTGTERRAIRVLLV